MRPRRKPDGKPTLDPARHPAAVDVHTELGTFVTRRKKKGAWNAEGDSEIRTSKASVRKAKLTQIVLARRAEGVDIADIADELGVAESTVVGWITAHRRAVKADEIDQILEETALPLAIENLTHGLIAGDKDYTLEVLKGRGKLKRYSEGDGKPPSVIPELTIRFEVPEVAPAINAAPGDALVGKLVGVPATPKQIGSGSTIVAESSLGVGAPRVPEGEQDDAI